MNPENPRRLFIAIPVDAACQQQLDALLLELHNTLHDIRWLPVENRHLTLAFMGDTHIEDLQKLREQFANAYQGSQAFSVVLNELMQFPDDKGRIIAAVNTSSAPLKLLYEQTQVLLNQCGLPVGKLPFRPHISLGKIKNHKSSRHDFRQSADIKLMVDRVNIYESTPVGGHGGEGRLYTILKERLL